MKKIFFPLLLSTLFTGKVVGQNEVDALRYSQLTFGSTTRSISMGGSLSGLGADFSVLASNPAGMGMYRRSEITFSPYFNYRDIKSEFEGGFKQNDGHLKFAVNNFGLIFSSQRTDEKKKGLNGLVFGLGYNRLNDFRGQSIAEGTNTENSLLDAYLEEIGYAFPPDPIFYEAAVDPVNFGPNGPYAYDIGLAWDTYLIDSVSAFNSLFYYSAVPYAGTRQIRQVETYGGQGEWDFSFAANIDEQLYMGLTFGIPVVNYREVSVWEERDVADTIPNFRSFSQITEFETRGSGLNIKFGLLFKPNDVIRLGAAIHSPSWYFRMEDQYTSTITADFDGPQRSATGPLFLPFRYEMETPWRAMGSLGLVIGKYAALTAEYEYVDYRDARFDDYDFDPYAEGYNFYDVNRQIDNLYTKSHTFRAGIEGRFEDWRLRAGAMYSTSPFNEKFGLNENNDQSRYSLSGGFGYRSKRFFFDMGYQLLRRGSYYQHYGLANETVPSIVYTTTDHLFNFTLGTTF